MGSDLIYRIRRSCSAPSLLRWILKSGKAMPQPFFFADINFSHIQSRGDIGGTDRSGTTGWMRNVLRKGAKEVLTAGASGKDMHTKQARMARAEKQNNSSNNFPVIEPGKCHTTGSYTCMRWTIWFLVKVLHMLLLSPFRSQMSTAISCYFKCPINSISRSLFSKVLLYQSFHLQIESSGSTTNSRYLMEWELCLHRSPGSVIKLCYAFLFFRISDLGLRANL